MLEIKSWKFIPFFFIKLSFFCFFLRFLFSSPLWCPGTEHGSWEALAPGHGQDALWPHGAMRAMSSSWHWARFDWAHERYGRLRVARGCGEREHTPARQDVIRKWASKVSPDCIMHMPGCPGSKAFRAHILARECWWLCEHVSSAFKRHVRFFSWVVVRLTLRVSVLTWATSWASGSRRPIGKPGEPQQRKDGKEA